MAIASSSTTTAASSSSRNLRPTDTTRSVERGQSSRRLPTHGAWSTGTTRPTRINTCSFATTRRLSRIHWPPTESNARDPLRAYGKTLSILEVTAMERNDVVNHHAGQLGDRAAHGLTDRRSTERSEEHTSELQSLTNLVCRLLLEKKKQYETQT